jgi:hypothetical protein
VVVTIVAFVAMGSATFLTSSAMAQTSFTAGDVSATSHNGQLQELTIAPEGSVTYEGLETPASGITVTVQVRPEGGSTWSDLKSKELTASGLHGSATYAFDRMSILQGSTFSKKDFRPADGADSTTQVDVRVNVAVREEGGQTVETRATDTFTVTVTNVARGAGVGGTGNTNAN